MFAHSVPFTHLMPAKCPFNNAFFSSVCRISSMTFFFPSLPFACFRFFLCFVSFSIASGLPYACVMIALAGWLIGSFRHVQLSRELTSSHDMYIKLAFPPIFTPFQQPTVVSADASYTHELLDHYLRSRQGGTITSCLPGTYQLRCLVFYF